MCVISVLNRVVGEGLTEKMTSGPRTERGERKQRPDRGNHSAKALDCACVGTFEESCRSRCGRRRVKRGRLSVPHQIPLGPF